MILRKIITAINEEIEETIILSMDTVGDLINIIERVINI